MIRKSARNLVADVGLVFAAAVWGSTFTIVKGILGAVDPVVLVAYRFLIAAAILGLYLAVRRVPVGPSLRKGAGLGLLLWALYVTQTVGLRYTTASKSGFITGLFIVFVPVLSFAIFGRKPSVRRCAEIALAVVGLFLLSDGLTSLNLGDALTLLTAAAYALHILYADRWVQGTGNPYALNFVQFLTVGVLSVACTPFFGSAWTVATPAAVWAIAFLAVFPTLIAFVIQLVAQRVTGPVKVALIFSLEPVFAALTAWTYGRENLIPLHAFGGFLIVAAIGISGLPARRGKTDDEATSDLHGVAAPPPTLES